MTSPARSALTQPRSDVTQRLKERIDEAKEIIPGRLQSADDLTQAEERKKKWRAYNVDMLSRMFTTGKYADEYDASWILVHQVADRCHHPGFNILALRLVESLRRQVASLESIIERLEFVDEPPTGGLMAQTEVAPLDRTKVFVVHGHDEGAREAVARFLGELIVAIVDGTAPADLTVTGLAKALPYSWIEQEQSIRL